jgi:hypothetical protein
MPSTDRKLELKARTSVAQTASQVAVYAKGLKSQWQQETSTRRLQQEVSFTKFPFYMYF